MAAASPPELLVLHAIRLKGMADTPAVIRRFSLDRPIVDDLLDRFEARGWIQEVGFADLSGRASPTRAGPRTTGRLLPN